MKHITWGEVCKAAALRFMARNAAGMKQQSRYMTWGEFKKAVEKQGIKNGDEIWYIDISFPTKDDWEKERMGAVKADLGVIIG